MTTQPSFLVLYGLPKGETRRYMESILVTGPQARIEAGRKLAERDGWHSFRTADHSRNERPNFAATLS